MRAQALSPYCRRWHAAPSVSEYNHHGSRRSLLGIQEDDGLPRSVRRDLFRRTGHAAEIGVAGQRFGIVHFDLRCSRLLRCLRFHSGLGLTRWRCSAPCF